MQRDIPQAPWRTEEAAAAGVEASASGDCGHVGARRNTCRSLSVEMPPASEFGAARPSEVLRTLEQIGWKTVRQSGARQEADLRADA